MAPPEPHAGSPEAHPGPSGAVIPPPPDLQGAGRYARRECGWRRHGGARVWAGGAMALALDHSSRCRYTAWAGTTTLYFRQARLTSLHGSVKAELACQRPTLDPLCGGAHRVSTPQTSPI